MEGAQQTSVSVVTEVIGHLVREPDRLEVVLVLEFRDIDPAPGSGEYAANLFLREGVSLDAGREVCASCKRNAADRSGKPGWGSPHFEIRGGFPRGPAGVAPPSVDRVV